MQRPWEEAIRKAGELRFLPIVFMAGLKVQARSRLASAGNWNAERCIQG